MPAKIGQLDKQYLHYTFSAYVPSAYVTDNQKTKLKLPTTDTPDYTIVPPSTPGGEQSPQKQGTTFTYGPFPSIPAGVYEPVSVRYEYTHPLLHVTLLERDIELSHWGGNIATEERYWLRNRAAGLIAQFSRVQWQQMMYYNPPTVAMSGLTMPLRVGSMNAYFTDDIGNVSTSRFRSNEREANLELKPRYPLFGDWKYKFKVGWDADLQSSLRKVKNGGDGYILRIPFLEGPKASEGVAYERVEIRVVLPEGAENVKYETSVPVVAERIEMRRTYMDTLGRRTLHLTALNLVDEVRERDLIVSSLLSFLPSCFPSFLLSLVHGSTHVLNAQISTYAQNR